MSSMWELSTDDVVTILIVACISALVVAWVFAGRKNPKKADNLEAMRLAGREAEAYVAPSVSPLLADVHVPTPNVAETEHAKPDDTKQEDPPESVLLLSEASIPRQTAAETKPLLPPAEKKPLSIEQSNAISIAAALVRHDKRQPATASAQNVEVCRSPVQQPSGAGGDDLTAINGIDQALAGKLNDLGVHYFDQIASWSPEHAGWIASRLGLVSESGPQGAWIARAKALSDQSSGTGPNRIVRQS